MDSESANCSANLDSRRVDTILCSRSVFLEHSCSVYLQSHGADNNSLAQSWGEYYFVPGLACLLLWQLSFGLDSAPAHAALSGLRGRPTGPDGSHLVLMPPPSLGGGGSGGGRRGGPVGSFARTSLSHSSLQRHAPRHRRLSPKACSWSILYSLRKQTISACHRQLYTLLITAGKFSNTIYLS